MLGTAISSAAWMLGLIFAAVAAYREALKREHVLLDWTTTQNNLGDRLRELGERKRDAADL
jgi:hypothetical protein